MLSIIVATDMNGGIGKDNKLMWHIPDDLKRFKEITLNKTVIMGRKTFESLPFQFGFPDRNNIVITNKISGIHDGVTYTNDIDRLIKEYQYSDEEVFVVGGAEIYKQFLPYCETIYQTNVRSKFEADTFFDFSLEEFVLLYSSKLYTNGKYDYKFNTFVRMKPHKEDPNEIIVNHHMDYDYLAYVKDDIHGEGWVHYLYGQGESLLFLVDDIEEADCFNLADETKRELIEDENIEESSITIYTKRTEITTSIYKTEGVE